ncbi:MFS transporter, partial [Chloroflexota bacterium]
SLATSLRGVQVGLLAPLMGILVDRWGPKRLVFGGSIVLCLGLLILSRISSLPMFYGAFVLIAIGMSVFTQTVMISTVAKWFRKKAGLAIGIVSSGFGLGGLMVPVITRLIDSMGWRMTMVTAGLGTLAIIMPLSFFIRHKPEQYGQQPDGDVIDTLKIEGFQHTKVIAEVSVPTRQVVKNRVFWHITLASMCHVFIIGAIITHMMPYLGSIGFDRSFSSMIALLLPVASIGGRLSSGWLADRIDNRKIFTASYVLMTVGLVLFGYVTEGTMWLILPFIITFSLGWGFGVTTRISLLRKYFGRNNFGTILGFLSGIMMLGAITGAPLAGLIFDIWGSYQGAWLGFTTLTVAAAVLALTIPSPNDTIRQPG